MPGGWFKAGLNQHPWVLLVLTIVAALAVVRCSEASSSFGRYYQGRTLAVSVVTIDRVPELRYAAGAAQQSLRYVSLTPSEGTQELVVIRLKIENHTATSAILNVDRQGAELRDFLSNKYYPIDVAERARISDGPPRPGDRSARVLLLQPDGTFPSSKGFIAGPFELRQGTGLDGWLVFEAPKGTKFLELRWQAGDTLTITF